MGGFVSPPFYLPGDRDPVLLYFHHTFSPMPFMSRILEHLSAGVPWLLPCCSFSLHHAFCVPQCVSTFFHPNLLCSFGFTLYCLPVFSTTRVPACSVRFHHFAFVLPPPHITCYRTFTVPFRVTCWEDCWFLRHHRRHHTYTCRYRSACLRDLPPACHTFYLILYTPFCHHCLPATHLGSTCTPFYMPPPWFLPPTAHCTHPTHTPHFV